MSMLHRERVLRAATSSFLARGYGSSVDDIARRAGVAKQTLYNHFGSKQVLFQAIVEQICDELMDSVNLGAPLDSEPTVALNDFARRFICLMVDPTSIGLFRLLAAEAHRFPDLAETVFRAGPDRVVADLARYLEAQHRARRLNVTSPALSAESFAGSLRGNLEIKALFSGSKQLAAINADEKLLEKYGRHCVENFLAAHGID